MLARRPVPGSFVLWLAGALAAGAAADEPAPLPTLDRGSVTLPWGEFKRLLDAAPRAEPARPPGPPVEHVLDSVALELALAPGRLTGTVEVRGQHLAGGWAEVPLLTTATALTAVKVEPEGRILPRDGWYRLLTPAAGPFACTLGLVAAPQDEPGGGSAVLELAPSALLPVGVTVSDAETELRIEGAAGLERQPAAAGGVRWSAHLVAGGRVALRWSRRAERAPEAPAVKGEGWGLSTLADRGYFETVVTHQGDVATRATLEVRNRNRPALRVRTRKGARLWMAAASGRPLAFGAGAEGEWVLALPLSAAGKQGPEPFVLSLVVVENLPALDLRGHLDLELPRLDLPVTEAVWSVTLPGRAALRSFEGPLALVEGGAALAWTRDLRAAALAQGAGDLRLPAEGTPALFRRLLWMDGPLPLAVDFEEESKSGGSQE